MDVWVEAIDSSSQATAVQLIEDLATASVDCGLLANCHPDAHEQCRIVVCSEGIEAVAERCAALHRQGVDRQLVVAANRAAQAGSALWSLLASGASDVLRLADHERPAAVIAERIGRWREVDRLMRSPKVTENLVGNSAAWRATLRQIVEIARFTASAVLVGGESGTGKELIARLIHTLDSRPEKGSLVLVDCTTLRAELSGSELFGHKRGAFTNAHTARDGALALADGGTLFLDEVGELTGTLQAELLRAVQEGAYKRLGSNRWHRSTFRLVCATHRDLELDVAEGRFRADLYHRLATWTFRLPSLAERRDDVPDLVKHLLDQALGRQPAVDPAVMSWLEARDYPGNVRELRQLVSRIAHLHVGEGPITVGDMPVEDRPHTASQSVVSSSWDTCRPGFGSGALERSVERALDSGAGLKEIREQAADAAVRVAVAAAPDQKSAAARLGVSPRAVQLRLAAMRRARKESSPERED